MCCFFSNAILFLSRYFKEYVATPKDAVKIFRMVKHLYLLVASETTQHNMKWSKKSPGAAESNRVLR